MTQIRIFLSGAWLAYKGLFRWTQPSNYAATKIVGPLGWIAFFTILGMTATGRESADFYIIGNAMQIAALNGIFGVSMCVGEERNEGTLIYLLGTPANRFMTFMGRAFFHVFDGMLTVVIGFFWGVTILGLDLSVANLPGLALAILVTAAATCGLGLLLGSLSLITLNVMFVNNFVSFSLLLLSGANVPLEKLPGWMQLIGAGLPLTRGIAAARLLVRGSSLTEVMPLLTGELAVGLTYALLGYALFSWFEAQAKRRGTLEAF